MKKTSNVNSLKKKTNRTPWLIAVTVVAGLGLAAGYGTKQLVDQQATSKHSVNNVDSMNSIDSATNSASNAGQPATQLQNAFFAQAKSSQTKADSTNYNDSRARTESEANTIEVVKARQSGLVFISVKEGSGSSSASDLRKRLRERFDFPFDFDLPEGEDDGQRRGSGSGFFVGNNGDIITNNHVVEDAAEIEVRLFGSKKSYKAEVISRAADYDLALIRIKGLAANQITPLPLGDSDQLEVGRKAIAMGAPFGLDFSVSEGIVSSIARNIPVGTRGVSQKVIQTDAAINPGNSGGPLLNSAGEVIGVNTQILTGGIGQNAGVGFSIPVNVVKQLLPQLQAGKGDVKTPTLGIQFTDLSILDSDQLSKAKLPAKGALVQKVFPNSPAARAGLRGGNDLALDLAKGRDSAGAANSSRSNVISTNGDVIVAVDGVRLEEGEDLRRAIFGKTIGDEIKLTVLRKGKQQTLSAQLQAFDFPKAEE